MQIWYVHVLRAKIYELTVYCMCNKK